MDEILATNLAQAWALLVRGGADRRSPLHTPAVASLDQTGAPDARIMVLRKADPAAATLRFHTDARSPKCIALHGQKIAILGYHPQENVQLRLQGHAQIDTSSEAADEAWARSTPFARRCYLVQSPPSSPLPGPASGLPLEVEGRDPSEAQLLPARANFALLTAHITRIDWLHLAHTGHRRAFFQREGQTWHSKWLTP